MRFPDLLSNVEALHNQLSAVDEALTELIRGLAVATTVQGVSAVAKRVSEEYIDGDHSENQIFIPAPVGETAHRVGRRQHPPEPAS